MRGAGIAVEPIKDHLSKKNMERPPPVGKGLGFGAATFEGLCRDFIKAYIESIRVMGLGT